MEVSDRLSEAVADLQGRVRALEDAVERTPATPERWEYISDAGLYQSLECGKIFDGNGILVARIRFACPPRDAHTAARLGRLMAKAPEMAACLRGAVAAATEVGKSSRLYLEQAKAIIAELDKPEQTRTLVNS